MELPESIKKHIGQEIGEKDQIGMSDSSILIFHDKVLKIQNDNEYCPSNQRLKKKLESAGFNVEHGLVDMDNVEPTTFGKGGFFKSPGSVTMVI